MQSQSLRQFARLQARPLGLRLMVTKWLEMRRTRLALARLDDRLLADIGLEHAHAKAEARRTF